MGLRLVGRIAQPPGSIIERSGIHDMITVLQEIPEPVRALSEVRRVL